MPRDVALQVFSEALQAARAMRPAERSAEALREIVQSLPSGANELVAEVLHVASLVGEAGPIANVLGISRSDQPFDPSTQSTMSILIVDADNFLRAGLRTFLQDQGFDVIEARDMATAAAIAATSVIDAAIIEVSIPLDEWSRKWERNAFGIDLARRLKAAQPDLGVVFQTAYADQLDSFLLLISEGIRGLAYCLKGGWQQSDLLKMIAYARSGGVFISPEVHSRRPVVRDALLEALSDTERPWVERALAAIPTLSGQEMRAASLLAAAVSADSVARQLSIQRADTLIGRVYDKLGLNGLLLDKHDLSPMPLLIKALDIHGLDK